jgi:probable rRNA maturation factor
VGPPICFRSREDSLPEALSSLVIFQKKVVGLSEASLERFVVRARRAARLRGGVDVRVTGNSVMRGLNLRFRGKNKATDVLSFPSRQAADVDGRSFAGDIAISADFAAQNALRLGHSAALEVKVLALHGILHLAGMDHERDNGAMARKEASLRNLLRLPAGLTERAGMPQSSRPTKIKAKKLRQGTRRRRA